MFPSGTRQQVRYFICILVPAVTRWVVLILVARTLSLFRTIRQHRSRYNFVPPVARKTKRKSAVGTHTVTKKKYHNFARLLVIARVSCTCRPMSCGNNFKMRAHASRPERGDYFSLCFFLVRSSRFSISPALPYHTRARNNQNPRAILLVFFFWFNF